MPYDLEEFFIVFSFIARKLFNVSAAVGEIATLDIVFTKTQFHICVWIA
jgi:hypothetical protein